VKVLLHIGSEKTGTTSIQHWAAANRAALAARGILYPAAPGERPNPRSQPNHVGLALAVSERARRPDLLGMLGLADPAAAAAYAARMERRLAEEIAAAGCATLLLSNEHLSSRLRDEAEVAALRALLERAAGAVTEWRIVLYHRRQDEMIQSIHAMRVLHGATEPFRPAARPDDPRLDPRRILANYARVFGEASVTVRVFDRARLVGGDAVADLMSLLGVDPRGPGFSPPPRANVSLGGAALELLRLMNAHLPATRDGQPNPARAALVAALRRLPPEPRAALAPRPALDAFLARYADVNAEIARRWLRRGDGALFEAVGEAEASLPVAGPLTAERAVALLAPVLARALDAPRRRKEPR
jgi:hypothetical protein